MAAVELPLHLRVLHRCVDGSWAIVLVCEGGAVVFFVVATTSGWVPMIWGWALLGVVSLVTMPLLCFETWEDDREELFEYTHRGQGQAHGERRRRVRARYRRSRRQHHHERRPT